MYVTSTAVTKLRVNSRDVVDICIHAMPNLCIGYGAQFDDIAEGMVKRELDSCNLLGSWFIPKEIQMPNKIWINV